METNNSGTTVEKNYHRRPRNPPDVLIAGAGEFGLTAAIELRRRGHNVVLCEAGEVPNPLAASTDISKVVRMEYGRDALYVEMAERALQGWRRWNDESGFSLFHETGVLFLSQSPRDPESFEGASEISLRGRGHPIEWLDAAEVARRFPVWKRARFESATFNPLGGWASSGKAIAWLAREAAREGVDLRSGVRCESLIERGGQVVGVRTSDGETLSAGQVVVASGAWTPKLVPALRTQLSTPGMPVYHFRPGDSSHFMAERFPVFGFEIARTGYYGFPLNDGVVKIANHGAGRPFDPLDPNRQLTPEEVQACREFVQENLPDLVEAPLEMSRICVYCDTPDGDFWIDSDPDRPGLVVATGGSGHAFKFAPVLGAVIADAVEKRENPWLSRFHWRPGAPHRSEAARATSE